MASVSIIVTGAADHVVYALVPLIARGDMLGPGTHVEVHLLDIEPLLKSLAGVEAELADCALPLPDRVVVAADPAIAFDGLSLAILCGTFPLKPGMKRRDLLVTNPKIFRQQGEALAAHAARDCRILVVDNLANKNGLIPSEAARGVLNPRHVTVITRLDQDGALALTAQRAGVHVSLVSNAIIWGNQSSTQVPNIDSATVRCVAAHKVLYGDAFVDRELVKHLQNRGAAILQLRGPSSARSAAKAAVDRMRDSILGIPAGVFVSMAAFSTGNPYGVPEGLLLSFPCTCAAGERTIVPEKLTGEEKKRRVDVIVA